jgi:Tol biopolymer transport system component
MDPAGVTSRPNIVVASALAAVAIALAVGCGGGDAGSKSAASGNTIATASKDASPGRLAYVAEGAGTPQLVTIRPDGTGKRQVTHLSGGEAANPDWSHDGSSLTYEASIGEHAGVFVSSPDGSNAHDLTPKGFQGQPAFSPNGRTIAFEREAGGNGVFLMNAHGSHLRRLTRNPFPVPDGCGCDTDPNFSPDGKTVTFVRVKRDDALAALFSIRVDGTGLRRLTPYGWDVAIKHDWSPDGKRIALTTNANPEKGTSANLVTIRPDGTGLKRLTTFKDGRSAYVGSYSPDGKRIAFRLERGTTSSLATMGANGGSLRTVFSSSKVKPRFIDWGT